MLLHEENFVRLRTWFEAYAEEFCIGDERFDSALRLKVRHTHKVVSEVDDIAHSLKLASADRCLARVMALLHDIGRFEQYARYQTYNDHKSADHGLLGANVLRRTGILRGFSPAEAETVIAVVSHHNRAALPGSWDARKLRFLQMVRDADKLDIWRVVTEHYTGRATNEAIGLGLPDSPDVSESVIERVCRGMPARYTDLRTMSDFKLLQLGWIFDLNFTRSFELARERAYLASIRNALPESAEVERAYLIVCRYMESRCGDAGA